MTSDSFPRPELHGRIAGGTSREIHAVWCSLRLASHLPDMEQPSLPTPQGNCIWNFLDIRVAEKAQACLNSTSYGVNLLGHCPQKSGFPHREGGRCRLNQLSALKSVCEKSKCDCPGRRRPNVEVGLGHDVDLQQNLSKCYIFIGQSRCHSRPAPFSTTPHAVLHPNGLLLP